MCEFRTHRNWKFREINFNSFFPAEICIIMGDLKE